MGWYDGELSGSTVNVYQYFTDNYNPYLQPTGTIDQNAFAHSDWNVLLNNVSKSVVSNIRKRIEYTGNFLPTSSILTPAELQDSYLTLRSYNTSRYEGSKVTSLLYNTYTSASYTGSDGFTIVTGDKSFGKTAAIDHNVRQIGLFTRIESSSFFLTKNTVALKYLVDEFGGLTELNQRNKHWEDIQRTFIAGDYLNVSLFDNKKYSNQKITDGNKLIFESGYLYSPILYFASCSKDPVLAFTNNAGSNAYTTRAVNSLSTSSYASGSSPIGYPISASHIMKLFDQVLEGAGYYAAGTTTNFPSYSVQESANHKINVSLPVTWTIPLATPYSASVVLQTFVSGSTRNTLLAQDSYLFRGYPATTTLTFEGYSGGIFTFSLSNPVPETLTITQATVRFFDSNTCTSPTGDTDNTGNIIIPAGQTSGNGFSGNFYYNNYKKLNNIKVNHSGGTTPTLSNGSTFTIGGVCIVTVVIDSTTCN
jgi:hypothetical protein